MKRYIAASLLLGVLLTMSSCILDEISIGLVPDGREPWFTFHYVKNTKESVSIIDLEIIESETGKTIWKIRAFNYPQFEPGKHDWEAWKRVKPVTLATLKFGQVPEGLEQVFPDAGLHPHLEPNVRYIVSASSAVSGKMEFMLSGECRKISLTSFSQKHPDYLLPERCVDVS
ncbi:MAG: hypothetical protein WBB60_02015 [Nitrospira sp.]|nr:hypothetical protein [Nitrospira sp.]MBP6607320.1 hypothetical protein [Nitrospira sp.]HQY58104.1 hypothetical protein [Nitrospira sp.]HRA96734.1 hypothetical protein [Nitrospira sp.]